jgi:hypothetical protein
VAVGEFGVMFNRSRTLALGGAVHGDVDLTGSGGGGRIGAQFRLRRWLGNGNVRLDLSPGLLLFNIGADEGNQKYPMLDLGAALNLDDAFVVTTRLNASLLSRGSTPRALYLGLRAGPRLVLFPVIIGGVVGILAILFGAGGGW